MKEPPLKRMKWGWILIGLILVAGQSLYAQQEEDDGDVGAVSDTGGGGGGYDTSDRRSATVAGIVTNQLLSFYLDTYGYRFSNGDLRRTDNTSYLTVDYTDDEYFLLYANVGLAFKATVLDYIDIALEFNKPGFWGNDSLSSATTENILYTREMNFSVNIAKAVFGWEKNELSVVAGRQDFEFCEDGSVKEYVFDDTIDAIKLHCYFPSIYIGGDVLVDFYSMNSPDDSIYGLSVPRHDYTVEHFDGDVNIVRLSVVPRFFYQSESSNTTLQIADARLYYLFSRIGATGEGDYDSGGYEMTGIGNNGNFADNDWVMIFGLSGYAELSFLKAYFEAAYSIGKDRKAIGLPDVDIAGLLVDLSLVGNFSFVSLDWLELGLQGVYAQGATTDEYGNYLNYGFVSFKGNRVGGFLFDTYYGNYPTAIVNYTGIDFEAIEASRRAATMAFGGSLGIDMLDFAKRAKGDKGLNVKFEGWVYYDNNTTSMNTNLSLPSNVYDQRRFGRFMGIEADGDVSYVFRGGALEVGVQGGLFVPMQFFFAPVSLEEAPYGLDTFWGVQAYTKLSF